MCHFRRQLVRGFDENCRNPGMNFNLSVSMAWVSNLTMVYFIKSSRSSWCELICYHFTNTGIHHEILHFDNSHPILGRILSHCIHNQTTADRDTNFYSCPAVGTALSFMGPGVPSLAVSSRVLGSCPWLCFFPHVNLARVSSNLLIAPWVFHRGFW